MKNGQGRSSAVFHFLELSPLEFLLQGWDYLQWKKPESACGRINLLLLVYLMG
jgi:hypothetical protein